MFNTSTVQVSLKTSLYIISKNTPGQWGMCVCAVGYLKKNIFFKLYKYIT